jgi:alpha-D-ribose 1-methylphosphonate 5-triphosphate synthase subunit PhnG
MVRARAGGTGAPFNLGEMTVTRCALRLGSGQVGHAYVAGRSHEKARVAALCDALMQDKDQAPVVRTAVLAPLAEAAAAARETLAAKAAATRVEFFTLARERA